MKNYIAVGLVSVDSICSLSLNSK